MSLDTYFRQPLGFRVRYTDTLTKLRSESTDYLWPFYLNSAADDLEKFKPLWMRYKESLTDKAAVAEWFARAESRRQMPGLIDRMLGPRLLRQQRNWRRAFPCKNQQALRVDTVSTEVGDKGKDSPAPLHWAACQTDALRPLLTASAKDKMAALTTALARCQAIQAEMARRQEHQWAPCGYGWQWHSWAWKVHDPFTTLRTSEQWRAENWKNRSIKEEFGRG